MSFTLSLWCFREFIYIFFALKPNKSTIQIRGIQTYFKDGRFGSVSTPQIVGRVPLYALYIRVWATSDLTYGYNWPPGQNLDIPYLTSSSYRLAIADILLKNMIGYILNCLYSQLTSLICSKATSTFGLIFYF